VPPPPDFHVRSHMQHRLLHLRVRRARGQRKHRQVLGRVVPLAAAPSRRVGSKSKHSQAHRYLSFDAVTEHIASEMRLILRSARQGQRPACSAELASTCRPLPALWFKVYGRCMLAWRAG
jgi:hypothetical protein